MPASPFSVIRRSSALLVLVGAVSGRGQIATSSPFLAPQTQAAAAANNGPLEFTGYMDVPGGERLFRIKDPARKTSEWVKLNEKSTALDVTVKQYDDSRKALVVEHQGKTLTLAEKESKIVSAGAVPQPVIAMPTPVSNPVPAAVTNAVVANPTPADEQRRLEAVAAEVARRRALREQATQQVNQGQAAVAPQANFQPNAGQPAQNNQNAQRRTQGGIRANNRQQK
jgi:hypothetical protein